jgi:hypothetical protein
MKARPGPTADSRALTLAAWLCGLPGAYGVIAPFVTIIPNHVLDKSWSAHARFHATWASGKLLALGICQILLAAYPLRARERWSWFALASNFVFGGLSILFASRVQVGPLRPLRTHDWPTRFAVLGMLSTLVGLVLASGPVFKSSDGRGA